MLSNLRQEYDSDKLKISELAKDPSGQFHHWFQDALKAGVSEPNAMTLATSTPEGFPSARIVLLKDYGPDGFSFFTNYASRKGKELDTNPNVALVFFWMELQRQVRIEGRSERLPKAVSEAYFQSRPRGSQIGAWASAQSQPIANREQLETKVIALEEQYLGVEVLPLPDFWGGYLVKPTKLEFWQGQLSRLHDRFQYTLQPDGGWLIEQLSP